MYQYKNKRTGSIIRTHGKLTGGDWELQGTVKPAANQEKEQPEETVPAAETSATKPAAKTSTKKAASTGTKPASKGKTK